MAGLSNLRYEQVPYEGYLSEGTPRTMPRATALMPPREMTLEEYLGLMSPQRRATLPEAPPQGLQAAPPASPSYATPSPEQYYRGAKGTPEEFTFTNIPEVAEQRGLRSFDLAPPSAQVGGVEIYGDLEGYPGAPVTSKLRAAQMTGVFSSPAPTSQANLMPRTTEEAQAEVQRMITVGRQKGYADNDILADIRERGLDKMLAAKETRIPYKIGDKEYNLTPEQIAGLEKSRQEEKVPVILPNGQTVNVPGKEALKYAASEENRKARQAQFRTTMEYKKQLSDKMIELKSRLEPALLQDVIKKEDSVSQYENLIGSFDKDFAGKVAFGPMGTAIYERTGGEPERVAWWKRFNAQDAALRHDLFGATMTNNEKAAWDRITVNENTNGDTAANELAVRHKIVVDNLARNLDKYEATGRDVSGLRQPDAAATGGGKTVTERRQLPDGRTIVMYSDGSKGIE